MILRRNPLFALAGAALVGGALLIAVSLGSAQSLSPRISFQILTGSTGGTYFPVGQLIAGLLSHPPGVDRCETQPVCGPSGVIISARTSEGAVANVLAVNAGRAESGLAQGDVVAQAVAGQGAFAKSGKQSALRVIADLFPEDVHLLVARKAKIASVADLKGKRVSLGAESSGTSVTARAILAAYGVSEKRLKARHDATDIDVQLMSQGKLDAFFFVGGRPVALVDDLLRRGIARLVPIDRAGRDRLIARVPAIRVVGPWLGRRAVRTRQPFGAGRDAAGEQDPSRHGNRGAAGAAASRRGPLLPRGGASRDQYEGGEAVTIPLHVEIRNRCHGPRVSSDRVRTGHPGDVSQSRRHLGPPFVRCRYELAADDTE